MKNSTPNFQVFFDSTLSCAFFPLSLSLFQLGQVDGVACVNNEMDAKEGKVREEREGERTGQTTSVCHRPARPFSLFFFFSSLFDPVFFLLFSLSQFPPLSLSQFPSLSPPPSSTLLLLDLAHDLVAVLEQAVAHGLARRHFPVADAKLLRGVLQARAVDRVEHPLHFRELELRVCRVCGVLLEDLGEVC